MYVYKRWVVAFAIVLFGITLPRAGTCETEVFQFESPIWSFPSPPDIFFPIVLGQEVAKVNNVRVSFTGVAIEGTATSCNLGTGECYSRVCMAEMTAFFTDSDSIRSYMQFPGDGVAYADTFVFENWDCSSTDPNDCTASPFPNNGWSFLNDGASYLCLRDDDWYQYRLKCYASFEITTLTIEIDYEASVAVSTGTWGALKAIYR